VDLAEMKKILSRIPRDSILHLVVTRELQENYFVKDGALENFRAESNECDRCKFFRWSVKDSMLKPMNDFNQAPYQKKTCAVIFIELLGNLKGG
jgi:hypothetical protein